MIASLVWTTSDLVALLLLPLVLTWVAFAFWIGNEASRLGANELGWTLTAVFVPPAAIILRRRTMNVPNRQRGTDHRGSRHHHEEAW